ncbi:hypothetical protein HKX48_006152 [Thoreauomyces humboldtii]|nr:hypothetical protein HKX48_006152 [Thoreauomyces humboldtii]
MATFFVALAARFYPKNWKQLALVKLKRLRVRTDDKIGEYLSAFEKVHSKANSEGVAANDHIRPEESIPIIQSRFKLSEAISAGYLFNKLVEKRVKSSLHNQIQLVNTLVAARMTANLASPQITIPKKRMGPKNELSSASANPGGIPQRRSNRLSGAPATGAPPPADKPLDKGKAHSSETPGNPEASPALTLDQLLEILSSQSRAQREEVAQSLAQQQEHNECLVQGYRGNPGGSYQVTVTGLPPVITLP